MNSNIQGFFLLTVSLFLGLIVFLVLSQMQEVFLNFKTVHALVDKEIPLQALEQEQAKLLHMKVEKNCILSKADPDKPIELVGAEQGCCYRMAEQKYCYLWQDLGEEPCLNTSEGFITHHWLFTIATGFSTHRMIMQVRYAKPGKRKNCGQKYSATIAEGIQSWRLLS